MQHLSSLPAAQRAEGGVGVSPEDGPRARFALAVYERSRLDERCITESMIVSNVYEYRSG